MKRVRQAEILKLIQNSVVDTQEQILELLRAKGFRATQATISRDIKELRLVKELSPQGYRYVSQARRGDGSIASRLRNIFKEGVLSVDVSQNIVVIRTMPGLASAACSALDSMEIDGIVGSLAGDDTGILIMRDAAFAEAFNSQVHKLLE